MVKFVGYENPEQPINKYVLCLQQGNLVERRRRFVGILLTSCKDNSPPKLHPWSVYIPPATCGHEFGALAHCDEIHTFLTKDVISGPQYTLQSEIMEKIDAALQFGVGWLNLEELKKKRDKS